MSIKTLKEPTKEDIEKFFERYEIIKLELNNKHILISYPLDEFKFLYLISLKEENVKEMLGNKKKIKKYEIDSIDVNVIISKMKLHFLRFYNSFPAFFFSEKDVENEEIYKISKILLYIFLKKKYEEVKKSEM